MANEHPNFFGSLAQGFLYGQNLKREDEERRRRDAIQTLQTLLTMQGSGAAKAADVASYMNANKAWLPSGLSGMAPQKLMPEMRQDILEGGSQQVPMMSATWGTPISVRVPTAGGKMVTSDQRRAAGLPSYEDIERERLDITTRQQNIAQGTQQLTLGDQAITRGKEEETPQAVATRALERVKNIVGTAAPGYVDRAITKAGGWQRLVDKNSSTLVPTLADTAYNEFTKESKIGALDKHQEEFIRAAMQTAVLDRQLQAVNAEAQLMSARYRLSLGSMGPLERLMDDVAKRLDQNLKDRQELEQLAGAFLMMPEDKVPDIMKPKVARLVELYKEETNLKTAQSRLSRGDMNVSQLLGPVSAASGAAPETIPDAPPNVIQQAIDQGKRLPRVQLESWLGQLPVNETDRAKIRAGIGK